MSTGSFRGRGDCSMEEMFGGIVYGKRAGEESLPVAVN